MSNVWPVLTIFVTIAISCFADEPKKPVTYGVEQENRHPFHWVSPANLIHPIGMLLGNKGLSTKTDPIISQYKTHLMKQAKATPDEMTFDGEKVFYPKVGLGFKITFDYTVMETPTTPMTLEQLRAGRALLQRDLFDLPRKLGMKAGDFFTQSHVHVGLDAFQNDPKKFLNFVIDYVNHSELALGAFNYDPLNSAPPLTTAALREKFKTLLKEFDEGKWQSIEELCTKLETLGFGKPPGQIQGALNVKTKYPTIEIRAMRGHQSADQMIAMIELLEKRIEFLNKSTNRIEFLDIGPSASTAQSVAQYHRYVTESGLNWDTYRKFLPRGWQKTKVDPTLVFQKNPGGIKIFNRCRLLFAEIFG